MAAPALLYAPRFFAIDANGDPLSGGKLFTYEPGTTTDKVTYADEAFTTPLANPIILDANGSAVVWLDGFYKFNLTDSDDTQIDGYPVDNFSTAPSSTEDSAGNSEWITTGDVVTFIDADEFSAPNDRTSTYQVGRRVKCTVTAGTVYGRVVASSFAASITTVQVVLDSGNLDSGLSVVDIGILSVTNPSLPFATYTIADATALTHAVTAQQISSGELVYAADTGAADVYVMTLAPAITVLTTGMLLATKIVNANATTTPTLNPNALGAKTIKRVGGAALNVGDLPANHWAMFRYDGTDMILQNPALHTHNGANQSGEVAWQGLPDGAVVQVVNVMDGAVATGTTTMPIDDTMPQNTEGDEFMTLAITPKATTNKLKIEVIVNASNTTNDAWVVALFQDAIANGLGASTKSQDHVTTPQSNPVPLTHYMAAGTISEITFKVRIGRAAGAGTITFNGDDSVRQFGGVSASSITITEVKA